MARHGYSRTEEEEERSRKAAEELKAQAAEASRASGRREGGRGVPGSAMAESSARSKEWADEDRRTPLGPGQTRQSIHTFGPEGRGYASAVTTRPAPAAPAGQAVLGAAQKKVAAEGEKDARRLAYLRRLRPRKSRYLRGTVDDRKFGQQQRESRGRIDSEMARIQNRQERRRKEGRQDDLIQQQREAQVAVAGEGARVRASAAETKAQEDFKRDLKRTGKSSWEAVNKEIENEKGRLEEAAIAERERIEEKQATEQRLTRAETVRDRRLEAMQSEMNNYIAQEAASIRANDTPGATKWAQARTELRDRMNKLWTEPITEGAEEAEEPGTRDERRSELEETIARLGGDEATSYTQEAKDELAAAKKSLSELELEGGPPVYDEPGSAEEPGAEPGQPDPARLASVKQEFDVDGEEGYQEDEIAKINHMISRIAAAIRNGEVRSGGKVYDLSDPRNKHLITRLKERAKDLEWVVNTTRRSGGATA